MIHKIYSVYDAKSEAYLPPFYMQTRGQAVRAISDCANDKDHNFGRHPKDYTLFEMGEFDDTHGSFDLQLSPEPIANCVELVLPTDQPDMFSDENEKWDKK